MLTKSKHAEFVKVGSWFTLCICLDLVTPMVGRPALNLWWFLSDCGFGGFIKPVSGLLSMWLRRSCNP